MEITKDLLKIAGVDPGRLFVGWVSAAEGQQFAQIVADFTEQIANIGPMGKAKTENEDKLRENLAAAIGALSSDRVRWLIGERETLVEGENVYGEQMSPEEYQALILDSLWDEYRCSKVVQAIAEEPLSAKEIAGRTGLAPREVLPYISELKHSGRAAQADTLDRSPRYIASGE
jgi:predicted Rossmann fold nucleotide-binding protein DprA/Smf involved in DNA uptake